MIFDSPQSSSYPSVSVGELVPGPLMNTEIHRCSSPLVKWHRTMHTVGSLHLWTPKCRPKTVQVLLGVKKAKISVDPRTSHSCCSRVKCTLTWRRTDVILIYYNLVFPLWKCFPPLDIKLFFQFTDEDHQNHTEHTLEGKKSNHRTWRQYPQNQAKKLHSISATNTQEPK